MTVGPWRPVSLQVYQSRIDELRTKIEVKEDLSVYMNVSFRVVGETAGLSATCLISAEGGKEVASKTIALSGSTGEVVFEGKPGEFNLWYPVGYGQQNLHTVRVTICDEVRSR